MADNVNGMYSFEEYTDMILIYGKVNKNGLAAVQEYRDTFPHRTPDRKTFEAVERRLRETGSLQSPNSAYPRICKRLLGPGVAPSEPKASLIYYTAACETD
ncbi:hypothetical protein J6590_100971 [Homalodisca vitripennis]|nr:hypothetical protein J6590_100971 [Homalodisca vitripennis]